MRRVSSQDNLENQSTQHGNSEQGPEDQNEEQCQAMDLVFDDDVKSHKSVAQFEDHSSLD